MKVGLFFGSFNPIHIGHLIIANTMVGSSDLDEVWFVVSPQNPFKKNNNLLHEFDRLHMVELAIGDNYSFKALDVEFHMPRPSYTVDTLTVIQEKHPKHDFVLIIGEDNLASFPRWKNHEAILKYFELYVYPRPAVGESALRDHPSVKWVKSPLLDISATFIRESIKQDRSVRYLLPDAVCDHIRFKKFYL